MLPTRKSPAVRLMLLALLVCVAAAAHGADGPPEIMPVGELKAGMRGYGVTAVKGTEPQRFGVEVLGVMRGWFPKGSMILIRLSGPVVEESGPFSGMSGSPIYVDDKLIGALAYGWSFAKVPIAGVTPAEEMLTVRRLEAGDRPKRGRADAARIMRARYRKLSEDRLSGVEHASEPGSTAARLVRVCAPPMFSEWRRSNGPLRWRLETGRVAELTPLPIPLGGDGLTGLGRQLLSGLDGTGLLPVQGAAGGRAEDEQVRLQPGVPVGAAFVTGDMDLSGMGTATWVEDDRVLAFGHPMFAAGEVDFPLVVGRAVAVIPSLQNSFRLSSGHRVVGRVTEDLDAGIVGRIGAEPSAFPVRVTVGGDAGERYEYSVTGFWQTAPMFALLTCAYSSLRWHGDGEPYTLRARAEISVDGVDDPLVLENDFVARSVATPAFDLVGMPLSTLFMNEFREVQLTGLDYRVEVEPGLDAAIIETVQADRLRAAPGSEVTLTVRLSRWRGEDIVRQIPVDIPETARPGTKVDVLVCDAMTNRAIKARLDPGFFAPVDFDQLLTMLQEMESNKNLVVRTAFVREGLRYRGEPLPALPSSALNILRYGGTGQTTQLVEDRVKTVPTPWVLDGARTLSITIEEE